MHTHPSESGDVSWRGFRFGRSANRNLSRGLLDGVLGGVGVIGPPPMGRGNRPRCSSPGNGAVRDENTLADGDGEEGSGDMDDFDVTFRGVHGVELVTDVVASPSKGRRLRSKRRRGRYGHEPAGETHSFGPAQSGIGEVSDMHMLWAALAVTST